MQEIVSEAKYAARHRGLEPAVSNWIAEQITPPALLQDGSIDADLADEQLVGAGQPGVAAGQAFAGAQATAPEVERELRLRNARQELEADARSGCSARSARAVRPGEGRGRIGARVRRLPIGRSELAQVGSVLRKIKEWLRERRAPQARSAISTRLSFGCAERRLCADSGHSGDRDLTAGATQRGLSRAQRTDDNSRRLALPLDESEQESVQGTSSRARMADSRER